MTDARLSDGLLLEGSLGGDPLQAEPAVLSGALVGYARVSTADHSGARHSRRIVGFAARAQRPRRGEGRLVDDIWTSSKSGALAESGNLWTARRSGLVWAWWLAWLVAAWVTKLVGRKYVNVEELYDIRDAAVADIVGNALSIVAAALAIAVVLAITRFQENHYRNVAWGSRVRPLRRAAVGAGGGSRSSRSESGSSW